MQWMSSCGVLRLHNVTREIRDSSRASDRRTCPPERVTPPILTDPSTGNNRGTCTVYLQDSFIPGKTVTMAKSEATAEEIPVGLYLLRRLRELGCKTVQGLPGALS